MSEGSPPSGHRRFNSYGSSYASAEDLPPLPEDSPAANNGEDSDSSDLFEDDAEGGRKSTNFFSGSISNIGMADAVARYKVAPSPFCLFPFLPYPPYP